MKSAVSRNITSSNSELRDFSHSLPMALLRSREAVMECFRPLLANRNITEQQWRILRALHQRNAVTISALCKTCCVSKPSMTGMLSRMEERGLIARKLKGNDQRATQVHLTRSGRSLINKHGPESEAIYREIEHAFGKKRLAELYTLLGELEKAAKLVDQHYQTRAEIRPTTANQRKLRTVRSGC